MSAGIRHQLERGADGRLRAVGVDVRDQVELLHRHGQVVHEHATPFPSHRHGVMVLGSKRPAKLGPESVPVEAAPQPGHDPVAVEPAAAGRGNFTTETTYPETAP